MTKQRRMEFGLLVPLAIGLFVAINKAASFGHFPYNGRWIKGSLADPQAWVPRLFDPGSRFPVSILVLAAWTLAPVFLRPLTFPNATAQQRYAVCAIILVAALAWLVLLGGGLIDPYDESSSKLGILIVAGLLACAGFVRVGWSRPAKP